MVDGRGNGNYLGQDFYGVQPCPKCRGKGFLNADGTPNNAFGGSDEGPFVPCLACQPAPKREKPDAR